MAMMFRGAKPQTQQFPVPGMPYSPAPIEETFMPSPQPAQATASGKPNWAGVAADFLAGLAGQQPVFAPQQAARKQREQGLQDAAAQRQAEVADWIAKEQWKRANPQPVNNDTVADYEFIRSKLGEPAGQEYLRNKANPPQYRQGPDGQFYRIDTSQTAAPGGGGQLPTFSEDDWNKAGGGASNGTGGFPR